MNKKSFFISNLGWEKKHDNNIINLLKKNNIRGIDFAPLQITSNWNNIEKKTVKRLNYP